ncbi:hypothetical protein TNCV_1425961 [Trichonephila clavipes]|nr:hypothetical protein TNCV_1425961 [Trichonephila clavipes]
MPILPVPIDNVVSQVFIESRALEQVVAIHSGMTTEWVGLISSQAKPVEVTSKTSYPVVMQKQALALNLSKCLGIGPTAAKVSPWFSKACGILGPDSIFINEWGNNTLCFSEGQGDFRLV